MLHFEILFNDLAIAKVQIHNHWARVLLMDGLETEFPLHHQLDYDPIAVVGQTMTTAAELLAIKRQALIRETPP